MDTQSIVNFFIGVAGFFGAFILNNISKKIERLDDDVRKMPVTYVTKDENRHDMDEIKEMLKRIFEKLDKKADK